MPTIAAPNQPARLSAMWAPRRSPWTQGVPWASSEPAGMPSPKKAAALRYQRVAHGERRSERRRITAIATPHSPRPARSIATAIQICVSARSGIAIASRIAPAFQASSWPRTRARGGGSVARKAPAKNWLAPSTSCETPPTNAR
ncbi:MAG: hypothetical protein JJE35_11140 [Thermoleophilia bacterium]|nr:hypothetical protein [Thermoleophilia bacterium]